MTKSVMYTRVSSEEQAKVGFSIPFQMARCEEHAKKVGLDLVERFSEAHSAKATGRAEFERMLRYLEEHTEVRTVLVHRVDRLIRNHYEYGLITEQLGVRVVSVVEPVEDTASGRLMHGMNVVVAKYHSDNLSAEVKKGLEQKFEGGGCLTKAIVGYRNVPRTRTEKAKVVLDELKAPLIRHLFERYATGSVALAPLALELAELGLLTVTGKPYTKERTRRLLRNPFYKGIVHYGRLGLSREGVHPPIVSAELFERVQEVMADRGRETGSKGSKFFLLRGVLWCATCNRRMTAEEHPRGSYYRCMPAAEPCPERFVPVGLLDAQVPALLNSVQLTPELRDLLVRGIRDLVAEHAHAREREAAPLRARLDALELRRHRNLVGYSDGTLTADLFREANAVVTTEMESVRGRLARLGRDITEDAELLTRVLETSSALATLYEGGTPEHRKALLQTVFDRITVRSRAIEGIEFKPPFHLLLRDTAQGVSKDQLMRRLAEFLGARDHLSSAA